MITCLPIVWPFKGDTKKLAMADVSQCKLPPNHPSSSAWWCLNTISVVICCDQTNRKENITDEDEHCQLFKYEGFITSSSSIPNCLTAKKTTRLVCSDIGSGMHERV